MFGFREVIAILSAACALVLLTLAARDAYHKRTAKRLHFAALGLYGMLFGVTAIILWTRGTIRTPDAGLPKTVTSDSKPVMQPDCSVFSRRSERNESVSSEKIPAADDIAVFNPLNAKSAIGRKYRNLPDVVNENHHTAASDRARKVAMNRDDANAWDEQVGEVVLDAFDAIELWFWRHGSPAPNETYGRSVHPVNEQRAALPDIMFVENTAELTSASIHRLRRFAGELMNRPQSGVIEIQAQTDGDGPAPFQFILTQARAEVVRDFLSNEGVLNYRLIATAMSPDSEDSTMAKSQIRFVFRP